MYSAQQPQWMGNRGRSQRNKRLWVAAPLLLMLAIVLALALHGCGGRPVSAASGGSGAHLPGGSLGAPSATSTAAPVSSPSGSNSGSATPPASGGSATPPAQPMPVPTTVPFLVTNVTVTTPQDYVGPCSPTTSLTFMATITVPAGTAGGTVSYRWVRSNGIESEDRMITFAPGQTAQPVSDTWGIGYGDEQPYNDFIQVFAPNYFGNVFSTDVHVTCQGAVTGITGSFTPTSYQCLSPSPTVTVTFTAVFTVIPGPATTINYQLYIGLNGNFGHPYTGSVQVPANATSVTMTKTFTVTRFSPRGTYYGFVSATAVDSSIVTFTKSC